jgi:dipeptidyl aminopeptidase/acylaminoacyl peptidase
VNRAGAEAAGPAERRAERIITALSEEAPMLRRSTLFALGISVLTVTVQTADTKWTPDEILKVRRVGSVIPSPDASRVAFTVSEAVMEGEKSEWLTHIHIAPDPSTGPGQVSYQLTRDAKSATSPRWSPDGQSIAFLSQRGGDKNNVFVIRVAGGEAEQITSEKASITALEWAPDGKSIAFVMPDPKSEDEQKSDKEKRDVRVIDENDKLAGLYVVPIAKDKDGKRPPRKLNTGKVHVTAIDWSPDSSAIVFSHQASSKVFDQQDISVVRLDAREPTKLAATKADESSPAYSRDGRTIAYVTSDDPPTWAFTAWVRVIPASGGTPRALANTFDEQPDILGWSSDGRSLIVSETQNTVGKIFSLPLDGGAPVAIGGVDVNVTTPAVNMTGTAVGFVHQWSDKAPEPFVSKLQPFAAKQVAKVQMLPDAPIGRTDVVRWKAQDGLDVEGLLTLPVGYEKARKVPLLVIVHGGPTGVFTQSFTGMPYPYPITAFAERGYAVLRVNPRGSSGYGRKFRYANYKDWGGGDYNDIMAGVDHVIAMGVADPDRLGIMGWSYGGYMTSWVITQTKRFKAASVGAGVTNLMSFTGTADIPGFVPDYFGGEYWEVFDRWSSRSAMFNVKGVTTPTLIQHGEDDRRVPISQGYELYNALVRQGVTTKMIVYPRQPHGLQEPKFIKDAMERNLEWFDKWIKGAKATTSSF